MLPPSLICRSQPTTPPQFSKPECLRATENLAAGNKIIINLSRGGPWKGVLGGQERLTFDQLAVVVVEERATAGRRRVLPAAATSGGDGAAFITTESYAGSNQIIFLFAVPASMSEGFRLMGTTTRTKVMGMTLVSLG